MRIALGVEALQQRQHNPSSLIINFEVKEMEEILLSLCTDR